MKTYLLDSFNRYKRFSKKLDVKTILCNKAWWVFNDSGEKEIYIFQEDGSLIVSINGNVINANWRYLPTNRSLIINEKEQSYMLHPAFLDDKFFVLQKDGTEQYSFMIMEELLKYLHLKSLSDLMLYFIEEEDRRKIAEIEHQKQEQTQREREQLQKSTQQKEKRDSDSETTAFAFIAKMVFVLIVMALACSLINYIFNNID